MRNTHRRIAALERALPTLAESHDQTVRLALGLLSDEHLLHLQTLAESEANGDLSRGRQLSPDEMAAQRAFVRAVQNSSTLLFSSSSPGMDMKRSILARLDRLESGCLDADWQPMIDAIVNGTEPPPGSAPIPLWVVQQVMEEGR